MLEELQLYYKRMHFICRHTRGTQGHLKSTVNQTTTRTVKATLVRVDKITKKTTGNVSDRPIQEEESWGGKDEKTKMKRPEEDLYEGRDENVKKHLKTELGVCWELWLTCYRNVKVFSSTGNQATKATCVVGLTDVRRVSSSPLLPQTSMLLP